jgi:HKD family nuclease
MDLVPGIYESIISNAMEMSLRNLNQGLSVDREPIPGEISDDVLSRYLQKVLKNGLAIIRDKALASAAADDDDSYALKMEIDACNRVLSLLSELSDDKNILDWRIGESGERLLAIWNKMDAKYRRPNTSISVSTLFTGGRRDLPIYEELCREIETSDEVDLLVSFIKYSGLRLIQDSLEKMTAGGGKLRVITTTYIGVTDLEAIERLSSMKNAEIRISYDSNTTRLHAKSYIFKRRNGFDTAFIGSSNLSNAAISDGTEWNVKLTEQDAPQVLSVMKTAFDTYWSSPDFEFYTHGEDREKLKIALNKEGSRGSKTGKVRFDIRPYLFQQEILDDLETERDVFGSYRNLVVAATGTGKTVVSAFDYKRFRSYAERDRLLYVAHRSDILKKSLETFRAILGDYNFGCLCDGNHEPDDMGHVFMTIASFGSRRVIDSIE